MGSAGALFWCSLALIGLLLIGFVAVAQVKKRLVRPEDTSGPGFTLSDLRALHRAGKMTDAEFEKAKEVVVAAAKKAAERQVQEGQQNKSNPLRGDRPLL